MTALLLVLLACEREPSFVGPWDVVHAERGGAEVDDVGFLDFDGAGSVVVFVAYDGGFVPLQRPIYTQELTNVTSVDIETFYNEREPLPFVEVGGFGAFDVLAYTGIRTVFEGDVAWPGTEEIARTTLILRR
jgi:hypothetical protein